MEKIIKVCDNAGCNKTEEKGNHWFKVCCAAGLIIISRLDAIPVWEGFGSLHWKDACGRKCASEMLTSWMGEDDPT